MKKMLVIFLMLLFSLPVSWADTVVLNQTETLDSPTAAKMDWFVSRIDAKAKLLQIRYRWLDGNGRAIRDADSANSWHTWSCGYAENMNLDCTDAGIPYECCTGAGTGTCPEGTTCFNDVFGFQIRAQDVGTSIGVGLRQLIWNKMKDDVLTSGNDGTFE